ncbi:GntR family transcriptional regulator [Longitalea arenae]|uniref:GntR family transcriptional regulator n=1 Tax=Longitalea arenae TaxID=2812558 RepID=UPI0019685914|nr:GntR family transcriptional regulator [Longitalea arenae]
MPVYLQLAKQLKEGISQGQYDPGKPLPSLYTFNRVLGISRSTVFRAYKYLNRNGDVLWIKGQGFFVRERHK